MSSPLGQSIWIDTWPELWDDPPDFDFGEYLAGISDRHFLVIVMGEASIIAQGGDRLLDPGVGAGYSSVAPVPDYWRYLISNLD